MVNLCVNIGGLTIKNPVMTASGTCGYGNELAEFFDVSKLGGIVLKGITLEERQGNDYPRMVETPSGMLNTVGLQNKGLAHFLSHIFPDISHFDTEIIVNVNGSTEDEYIELCDKLNDVQDINAIELNISCPNVKKGGMSFGINPKMASKLVAAVRKVYTKHLMVKLTPNVTDISEIAIAVEESGADSISLVNTFVGMAVDVESKTPILSTITGGLSGPCIKPIALQMVWQVCNAVKIPIIGMGGISNANDAIEFILVGATAIQIGTANFIDPLVCLKVIKDIEEYMLIHGYDDITDLIGGLL